MSTQTDDKADVYMAVAHKVRRRILDLLAEREMTVKEIAAHFNMSRPAVSQHLAILLEAKLVERRSEGRQNYYRLQAEPLKLIEAWLSEYRRFWESKLDSLERYLDRKHGEDDGTTDQP